MKITYFSKPDKEHLDSFWYNGDCALLQEEDRECLIVAVGEIRIHNKEGELVHDGYKERNNGLDFELNKDKDLEKIDDGEKYFWENNNWFDIMWKKRTSDTWEGDFGFIAHDYDEAINTAKEMLTKKEYDYLWK